MSRLRSNKVVNQAGSGAPELTYGAVVPGTGTISGAGSINVTGVITATSFSGPITGSGSNLTSLNASEVTSGTISDDRLPVTITKNINSSGINTLATLNVTNNTTIGGNATIGGNVTAVDGTFSGNLTVQGTTTTIDTATLNIEDRNIGIASVSNPSDTTADGAGLTIFAGADGNKILQWVNIGDGKWQFVGGTVEASNFVKSDGTPVAGDSDITSCLFV